MAYAQTVRPLPGNPALTPPAPPPSPTPPQPPAAPPATASPKSPATGRRPAPAPIPLPPAGQPPGGLDRATWERFRTGRLSPARTLDLHGLTAALAHQAVTGFILGSHAAGLRCIEIVTGRGSTAGAGTLRREFPHWLATSGLSRLILATTHPRGNTGATRLLLRRARPLLGVTDQVR